MSIEAVHEVSGTRGSVDEKGITQYTRKFQVITTAASVGAATVRTATGVPRIRDVYATATEFDTTSLCRNISCDRDNDNPRLWTVAVDYGALSGDEDQSEPNPLQRPSVVTWSGSQGMRVAYQDINGAALLNGAGEYFDPPLEVEISRPQITISRNEISFNGALAMDFENAVNSGAFLGFPSGTVRCTSISATSQREGNYSFWNVTYQFALRREGWQPRVLNQGRNKKTTGGVRVPVLQRDIAGNEIPNVPISDPVPLTPEGYEVANPGPNNVHVMQFEVYQSRNFSSLGLP